MKTTAEVTGEEQSEQRVVIPVIEEHISIGTAIIEKGAVRIAKEVTENEETLTIPLTHDEHSVEHVPMNVFVDETPVIRREGDTIIVPVLKEVMVKRVLLVEEIRISKHAVQTNEEHNVKLRTERVTVERIPLTGEAR